MSKVTCLICDSLMPGHWADYPEYPFCSPRCKKIDLGRWLSENYRVASPDDPDRSTPGQDGSDPDSRSSR